jgi:hypothetical protein
LSMHRRAAPAPNATARSHQRPKSSSHARRAG